MLTLSSSIFFLTPIILCHLIHIIKESTSPESRQIHFSKLNIQILGAYAFSMGLCIAWYLLNYVQYYDAWAAHRQMPQHLISAPVIWVKLVMEIAEPLPLLLLIAFFLFYRNDHVKWMIALFLFFPCISALLLGFGPSRVYIPILIWLYMTAAAGCVLILDFLKKFYMAGLSPQFS